MSRFVGWVEGRNPTSSLD